MITEQTKQRFRTNCKMKRCYYVSSQYGYHDMIVDRTGIRFLTIDGQTSAAIVCSLNYENEGQRTIDSVLSLD